MHETIKNKSGSPKPYIYCIVWKNVTYYAFVYMYVVETQHTVSFGPEKGSCGFWARKKNLGGVRVLLGLTGRHLSFGSAAQAPTY